MRWKWVFGILAALMLAMIVTIYVTLSRYDLNDLKSTIIQTVKEKTGRELILAGDIKLKMSVKPALIVEGVSFKNASWGSRPVLARIKRFEVQVDLLPLISGDVKIKRLILIEPDILIETDPSGKSNLRFTVPKKPKKTPTGTKDLFLLVFRFDEIKILKGRFKYKNGQSGRFYEVNMDNVVAHRTKIKDQVKLKSKGFYKGRPFEVSGTTGLFSSIIDPQIAWPLKLRAKAGRGSFTLDGTIRDVLNGRGLNFAITSEGVSIPDLADFAGVTGLPDLGPFKAKYTVSDPNGSLTIKNISATIGTRALAKIELQGAIRNPLERRGIDLDFQIQGSNLANLKKFSGKPFPLKGPFKIQGHVLDAMAGTYNIYQLVVTLGKNRVEGSLEISLSGKRPRLKTTLSSARLDLRPVVAKKKKKDGIRPQSPRHQKPEKVFSNKPFALGALRLADARIKVRVGKLLLPRLAFNKLKLDMSLKNRRLVVKSLKANMGGGTLDAFLRLDARKKVPRFQTFIKIEKLNMRRMLKDLNYREIITGNLDLDLRLNGRGTSMARVMGGLNGKILAVVGKGRIANKHIEMLGTDLSSTLFQLINPLKAKTKYTQVNCLVNRFDIKAGIAEATVLVMDTPLMSVVGQGKVYLKTETLDLPLEPSPKKGIAGVSMSLAELAQPFRLKGTLARPHLGIDTAEASLALGKAVGGFVLFGPAGILAVLAGRSSSDEDACLEAIKAAELGFKTPVKKKPEKKQTVIDKTTGGIKKTFKKLFD